MRWNLRTPDVLMDVLTFGRPEMWTFTDSFVIVDTIILERVCVTFFVRNCAWWELDFARQAIWGNEGFCGIRFLVGHSAMEMGGWRSARGGAGCDFCVFCVLAVIMISKRNSRK